MLISRHPANVGQILAFASCIKGAVQKSARGHDHRSGVFQPQIVVHGMAEFLLAAEVPFGSLNRCVAKQKLNLLKFSACEMA